MRFFNKSYFNLLREVVISEFKLKDQSTFFGLVWSFLHPLMMLSVLFIFFNLRIGREIPHYAIYLLIGIVHYTHFSNTTNASMSILTVMKQLTSDTIFPKEILVIGSVLANTIELIISMLVCLLIAYFSGVQLSWAVTMLLLVLILQLMLALWVSLVLSCLYILVKDIGHIYQVFLRILFFITPTFYGAAFLRGRSAKYLVLLNPLAHLMTFSRKLIIEGTHFPLKLFIILFVLNAVLIFVGLRIFKINEPKFAEYV